MSDVETRFHETWLGMVQPVEGLVVSVPVLVEAECLSRQPPELQRALLELCPAKKDGARAIADLGAFFERILDLDASCFDAGDALPTELSLWVPEGSQKLTPTMALKKTPGGPAEYIALVQVVDEDLELDKPETRTGPWAYPPAAKLDRLLRATRVPIGLLTNRRAIRLIYAPHGESTGSITFRVDDMASVAGRPILDALVMLLSRTRLYTVAEDRALPKLLEKSRKHQANVTGELADQVFEAIEILLRGFEEAAERDGSSVLREAVERGDDHVYGGLLTVLLRLVFILYAEDWSLLPVESPAWSKGYSVVGLYEELLADRAAYPDSMSRRFGAWGRLVALFRAVFLGVHAGDVVMPARRGNLFDPQRFPFLEGWEVAGGAPIHDARARAAVRVPTVDDEAVFNVLERLVVYGGQRLSYRALDVEQLGSVYEGLMGYHVERLTEDAVAIKVKNKSSAARAWVEARTLLAEPAGRRAAWLEDELGFDKATAKKVGEAVKAFGATDVEPALEALLALTPRGKDRSRFRASAGRLVLQPGKERRRTSSHYTPRELTAPIVAKTVEPLLAVMGDAPASDRVLSLKVCDPAMGSGAFLVEACRYLANEVVKAWTREGKLAELPPGDPLLYAKRLVAQQCLYGVDKNPWAVDLAKLSLWLVTLAKDLPFTFVDHALSHGDSLVGLDFDQIRAGHWKPSKQLTIGEVTLREALDEAIAIRQKILELARDPSPDAQREKERLMADAKDATQHARLLADVVVGAFFAHEKDKDREKERQKRVDAFVAWKASGATEVEGELLEWQREIRERIPLFHWMLELPEVFYAERPDPLDEERVNRAAMMDGFVGNPPFMHGLQLARTQGSGYVAWLGSTLLGADGRADLCSHFMLRAASLLGAHGTMGLIATNTISQGDTRESGLSALSRSGFTIYSATRSMPWPGDASVAVSIVFSAVGAARPSGPFLLDDTLVPTINSRLQGLAERSDPIALHSNAGLVSQGIHIYGSGFVIEREERDALLHGDTQSEAVLRPFIGGEEVNSHPRQDYHRFVINFGKRDLNTCADFPAALEIVKQRVKPYRDGLKPSALSGRLQQYWWQFYSQRDELAVALRRLARCLVNSQVSKHLVFAWEPAELIFGHTLYVYSFESQSGFASLQSRVHEPWARLLSSSLEDRLRYSASDCFETFPFPTPDPRAVLPSLEDIGQRLYDARASYMVDENVGLTITYNRLKDPKNTEARVLELRRLHEEMDRAVLDAYGWTDVAVPPYCPLTDDDKKALEAFEDEVIDRLFVLNAKRAEEERAAGVEKKEKSKGKGKKKGGGGDGPLFE